MPLTFDSGQTPERRNEEALRIIKMFKDANSYDGIMEDNERRFITTMLMMYDRYSGEKVFVTPKQLFWLRDLKDRYL